MSRFPQQGPQLEVAPKNNVYTAIAAGGLVVTLGALVYLFIRAQELFGGLM